MASAIAPRSIIAKRLAERDLEDLDVLVVVDAAALSSPVRFAIRSNEAGDLLGHAARAHIGVEGIGRLRMAMPVSSSASRTAQILGGSPSSMPAQASIVASAPSLR